MKKIYLKEHLKGVKYYPIEVVKSILRSIELLDDNYGVNRNIEADLGGYVFIAENIVEVEILKQDKLNGIVSEYTDIIECSKGVNWTSSLFLLSSDYSIIVVTTEELSKLLLE
ncbi:hypothetical protein ACV3RC_04405 [Clostridium perfringens]|uniref:hypothetical protein n=1 Tax=Clostridium perfringens TaxID=1502 RepID=UPI001C844DC3|nr:hypothetical protein [Clostridium perfringens]EHK2305049.1 hypothetical protein [Clostridium perfringens]MDK0605645.1 hypothetical protein [Clostridium perfringens]MDK0764936.1 hypothetical protein [Clostridium perfringens]MDK0923864.1 hypothetical protein [Clostridium perfringens]MDM0896312.1 hypothetical protein [Clostridium perfringens]